MGKRGVLVEAGTFCPNEECGSYQQVDKGNSIGYGKSRQGRQRYQCKECKRVAAGYPARLLWRRV